MPQHQNNHQEPIKRVWVENMFRGYGLSGYGLSGYVRTYICIYIYMDIDVYTYIYKYIYKYIYMGSVLAYASASQQSSGTYI
jgi:hypothetical protein